MELSFIFPLIEEKKVSVTDQLPSEYHRFLIPHTRKTCYQGNFGTILSQTFRGKGYRIQYHHFFIQKEVMLAPRIKKSLLMINYMLEGTLLVPLYGVGELALEEGTYRMLYLPDNPFHQTVFTSGTYRSLHINFSSGYFESLSYKHAFFHDLLEQFKRNAQKGLAENPVKISAMTQSILNSVQHYSSASPMEANLYYRGKLTELLLDYTRNHPSFQTGLKRTHLSDEQIYDAIRDYIENHLHKKLTVARLSRRFGVGRTRLYRIFKKHQNLSVHQYIRRTRLETAVYHLNQGDLKLRTIATMVGYSSADSLRYALKKEHKIQPKS